MAGRDFEKPAVLIAEDEEINRTILREILKDKYRILEAENGHQAVFYVKAEVNSIVLIILDIHMPKLDGFGVMDYLLESGLNEKIPVIITTSDQSTDVLVQARKNRAVDIIYKPFRASDIRKRVDTLVSICNVEQKLDSIISETSEYLTNQYEALKKAKTFRRGKWEENILKVMDDAIPDNIPHNRRMKAYVSLLCEHMSKEYPKYGISKSVSRTISEVCVLHDLGQLAIPDSVFDRSDATAHRGLLQIKKRPVAASEMVNIVFANASHQTERKYAYDICRYMYEQFDGKGYPEGLVGNEIPISAQMVGLAHRYDELRFTKNGNETPHKQVMRKIMESEYKAYNPDLLDVFEEISAEIEKASREKNNE